MVTVVGGNVIKALDGVRLMDCAEETNAGSHLSFYYNKNNGSCIIHDTKYPEWNLDEQDNWIYYVL